MIKSTLLALLVLFTLLSIGQCTPITERHDDREFFPVSGSSAPLVPLTQPSVTVHIDNETEFFQALATCGTGSFDLSSVTRKTGQQDFSFTVANEGTFYLNVCGPLISTPSCVTGTNSQCGSCQKGTNGLYYNNGAASSTTWKLTNNLPSLVYGNGQLCGTTPRTTTVNFVCDATKDPGQITAMPQSSSCIYIMTFASKYACGSSPTSQPPINTSPLVSKSGSVGAPPAPPGPPPPPGSFNYGWIFVIVVCVSFVVYIVFGMVYKRKRQEARGLEMIPNIDFWKDLPFLVKDGFVFIFSGIRRCFNRGQYSSL